jgi:hypothetical protein
MEKGFFYRRKPSPFESLLRYSDGGAYVGEANGLVAGGG